MRSGARKIRSKGRALVKPGQIPLRSYFKALFPWQFLFFFVPYDFASVLFRDVVSCHSYFISYLRACREGEMCGADLRD